MKAFKKEQLVVRKTRKMKSEQSKTLQAHFGGKTVYTRSVGHLVFELVKRLLLWWAPAPSNTLPEEVCQNGTGVGEGLDMAAVEVALPNETAYIMELFLGVFMSYLSIHQGVGLRGRWGPPPIANVKPQLLHGLLHEVTLLQPESYVVLLADRKELTQDD